MCTDKPLIREDVLRLLRIAGSSPNLDLRGRNLEGIDLSDLILSEASLQGANLQGADLSYAVLERADFLAHCIAHEAASQEDGPVCGSAHQAHYEERHGSPSLASVPSRRLVCWNS